MVYRDETTSYFLRTVISINDNPKEVLTIACHIANTVRAFSDSRPLDGYREPSCSLALYARHVHPH